MIYLLDRKRTGIFALSLIGAIGTGLAGCSNDSDALPPSQEKAKEASATKGETVSPSQLASTKWLYAGGGLKGIELLPPSARLSADEMAALFDVAYPRKLQNNVEIGGDHGSALNAEPFVAFKTAQRTVLVVTHSSNAECHGCAGALSFFYFDPAGTRITKSFPLAIKDGSWGQPSEARLTKLGDGKIALVLLSGFMAQGFTVNHVEFLSFDDTGVKSIATFPEKSADDNGMMYGYPFSVELAGAELKADGKSLTVRYTGEHWNEASTPKRIDEEHVVTLDGIEDNWIKNWKYAVASE